MLFPHHYCSPRILLFDTIVQQFSKIKNQKRDVSKWIFVFVFMFNFAVRFLNVHPLI